MTIKVKNILGWRISRIGDNDIVVNGASRPTMLLNKDTNGLYDFFDDLLESDFQDFHPSILMFAVTMQEKLAKNTHKDSGGVDGWHNVPVESLLEQLEEEVDELVSVIDGSDQSGDIAYESADVGNVAMMISDNTGALHNRVAEIKRKRS